MKKYLGLFLLIVVFGGIALIFLLSKREKTITTPSPSNVSLTPTSTPSPTPEEKKEVYSPLADAKSRITKKPFGIYITPETSPVQPERFSGFHTGTDFEVTPDELNQEVSAYAIADGEVIEKQIISGYGGVIIQSATISGQKVTVLYGHLNISAPSPKVGAQIKGGSQIAFLADNQSEYSGYERKHLHLGIHKGEEIEYRGYVSSEAELSEWIDLARYL